MIPRLLVFPFVTILCFFQTAVMASERLEPLDAYVQKVVENVGSVPEERKPLLDRLAKYIAEQRQQDKPVRLTFICTHNSRRSHLSQIWMAVAAAHYGFDSQQIQTFSGGTESTACNIRTVRALRRAGFSVVNSTPDRKNPVYLVQYTEAGPIIRAFSKKYTDEANPQKQFAAVLSCSDADESCPIVAGADRRFPLHYFDPKVADDTPQEAERYDERCLQIATEMFYIMQQVRTALD